MPDDDFAAGPRISTTPGLYYTYIWFWQVTRYITRLYYFIGWPDLFMDVSAIRKLFQNNFRRRLLPPHGLKIMFQLHKCWELGVFIHIRRSKTRYRSITQISLGLLQGTGWELIDRSSERFYRAESISFTFSSDSYPAKASNCGPI